MNDPIDNQPREPLPGSEAPGPEHVSVPMIIAKLLAFTAMAIGAFFAFVGALFLASTDPLPAALAVLQIVVLGVAGVRIARARQWGQFGAVLAIMLLVNALLFGLCMAPL